MKKIIFITAWVCTLAGDYFLSVTQTHLTLGIGLFCIVQTMYMLYLFLCPAQVDKKSISLAICPRRARSLQRLVSYRASAHPAERFCLIGCNFLLDKKPARKEPAVRIAVFVFLLAVLLVMNMLTLQNALAVLDISLLGYNMFKAWMQGKSMRLFAVGLSLFFCCDICVGLRFILPQEMSSLMFVLIWTFYLPSQILIVIYGIRAASLTSGARSIS